MSEEYYTRCLGCDMPITDEEWEADDGAYVSEVTTKYGDGFAHEECMRDGMMEI